MLAVACRAFPPEHRARRSDEVVDTALLAAEGSTWHAAREALSLVGAGGRQRLRAEAGRSMRDGAALLAGTLAVVNLAVAVAGITASLGGYREFSIMVWGLRYGPLSVPYFIDWWWIAFALAAAGVVFGLARGHRRLALGAAGANLGLVAYDTLALANDPILTLHRSALPGYAYDGRGHFDVFTYAQTSSFPGGRQWLAAAVVLALATLAARPRRRSLVQLPSALLVAGLLAWLSRETWGAFFFLRWPVAAVVLLAVAFGAVAPRLAVLGFGVTLAATPSVLAYLTETNLHHDHVETGVVMAGLAVGFLLPLVQLTRRRLA
jgi:hypothetical protein